MLSLNLELRRTFRNADTRGSTTDNAIRDLCGVVMTINTHRLWQDMRLLAIDDVARTVMEATGLLVDHVKLVTPADIAAEMLLWPPRPTLWDHDLIADFPRRAPGFADKCTRMREFVVREIDELAKYGIRKNFYRYSGDVQDQLVRQFGHVAGDACANHLALSHIHSISASKRTGALVSLMVTASPFMTRDPLNPHKLLILVDNDI